jgi:hypothetical protein
VFVGSGAEGLTMKKFPVDVVYTWVDGSDSRWLERKKRTLDEYADHHASEEASGAGRFRNNDELKYSVRSVMKFAPWIRRVFIVTDDQVPEWLDTSNRKIEIVDHKDIFGNKGSLPSFNSHAIEMRLHHIPGLSERFLYFNDDVFLGRPTSVSDFFYESGMGKLFTGRKLSRMRPRRLLRESSMVRDNPHQRAVYNARRMVHEQYGYIANYDLRHTVKVSNRTVLLELESRFPQAFRSTIAHQFRDNTDVLVSALAAYYEMAARENKPYFINILRGDLRRYSIGLVRRKRDYVFIPLPIGSMEKITGRLIAIRKYGPLMFCINDGPGTSRERVELAMDFLEEYFPERSECEL